MAQWNDDKELFDLMKEKLYTPVVGDILDQMGYKHQFLPAAIRPLEALVPADAFIDRSQPDNRLKLAGYACTVLENDVFDSPKKPTGAHHSALWGELLTATAKARGAVGAVLDGYSRDTPQVLEQNFPVFCTQCWAQDSSVRTYVCDYRCTIEIGQVTIHDGDLVFGDIDGVLIIPAEVKDEVIEKALIKAAGEKTVRRAIEGGMSATDAFAEFGIL